MNKLALALLFAASPAFAGLTSTPDGPDREPEPLEGLYAALGGGYGLQLNNFENVGAYDAEARLGYSFNAGLQVYLGGSVDGSTIGGRALRNFQIAAFVQKHLYESRNVGFYGRAGIGIAIAGPMPDLARDTNGLGLATTGGLGLEIRLAPGLYLGPEFFYRHTAVTATGSSNGLGLDTVGLQLNLIYY
jgi:hypothetical protein